MRPIDADALRLMKVAECEGHTIEYAWGWKSCVEYCKNDAPTIEAITREQYHDMTERFFDEFVDNGADEETVAKCMFIGLAFGKLELMLFGENEDGDSDELY